MGPRRPLGFILGMVIALTAPFSTFVLTYVWGAFPTVDKAGSLLFYLDGAHWRFLDATDPAVRLIGVHMGHLWIVAALDLLLEPFAAFNVQALLNLIFGWYCAWLLLEELSGDREVSLLMAFPYGMGLHLFRDINWYTIEKSGVYWIPLYAWTLVRASRRGGGWIAAAALVYVGTMFYNLYLGVLCAGLGAVALLSRDRRVAAAVLASAVAALPLVWLQARLLQGPGTLGDPETFLTQRAALDVVELWPPLWNRLEAWRALNVVALGIALLGAVQRKNRWLVAIAAVFFVLSLGPSGNPVYRALALVPGFWRIAKPETFFHVTWIALLAIAARRFADARPSRRAVTGWGLLFALGWIVSVRTHPVYPRFTEPIPMELSEHWRRSLPGATPEPSSPSR
jgi:hypothetical protein